MQSSTDSVDDEVAYRQVSPTAVVALVLGIGSLLALVGPPFFAVPAAAVGAALLALSRIRGSDGALTGAGLARLAIALALACTAAALVRTSVRDALMQRQATELARQWMDLLTTGRMKDARALLSGGAAAGMLPRRAPNQPEPAQDEAKAEAIILDKLRSDPLTQALSASAIDVALDEVDGPVFEGRVAMVGVTFTLGSAASNDHRHASVSVQRSPLFEADGSPWRVNNWNVDAPHGAH